MDTVLSPTELVANAARLVPQDLEYVVQKLVALRASRQVAGLNDAESVLMEKINRSLPAAQLQHFQYLDERRRDEMLTATEHTELLTLIIEMEKLNVERVQYLTTLAQLRNVTVRELIQQLGLLPNPLYV